jgi:hypothetical protein
METKVKEITISKNISKGLDLQILMRETPLLKWFEILDLNNRLSGTLKKNSKIGFKCKSQLLHEAICQTLGWGFESIPCSYLTFNDPVSEGDCKSITEVGWHFDRLLCISIFPEDNFELKYINIQDEKGNIIRQGIGIIVKETSVQWIPNGHLVFCLLTEYDNIKNTWSDCINPF